MSETSIIIAPMVCAFYRAVSVASAIGGGDAAVDDEFGQVLIKTIPIAIIAFFVSGFFLVMLWRSLVEEAEKGQACFTARSRRRMLYLVLSLVGFGLIFGWLAFNAP